MRLLTKVFMMCETPRERTEITPLEGLSPVWDGKFQGFRRITERPGGRLDPVQQRAESNFGA
jgi:hypothetical protein